MNRPTYYLILTVLIWTGCSLWEYDDPSEEVQSLPPETYISVVALDTIYASIDSIGFTVDPASGDTIPDTSWVWYFDDNPPDSMEWDILPDAFTTIMTSRQQLHWWGEDPDGDIVGYYYKWSTDSSWTYTQDEQGLFFVPITSELDVFSFQVKAMDQDSIIDATPARLVLPIQNSAPEISFRYRSNPLLVDMPTDTSFTFPTRTFVWDVYDQDGNSSITDVFYAIDDPCDSCWVQLDAAEYASITITGLSSGFHTFYAKTRDIAGAESDIISFPDTNNIDEPDYWKVLPVVGNTLIVDDFPQDDQNVAQSWYRTVLDTIVGSNDYSVWEIGDELPFSSTDVTATLQYFDHIVWYAAYTQKESYLDASGSIMAFIAEGGNFFLNAPELKDSTFTWFPLDNSAVLNPNGRLLPGTELRSEIRDQLDLETSQLIAIRIKHFTPDSAAFSSYQTYYRVEDNIVAAGGRFQVSHNTESGDIVLMSVPIHNGINPIIEGNGSAGKFIKYVLAEVFE